MRFYQLTGLERNKLEDEYEDLKRRMDGYRGILSSECRFVSECKNRITRNAEQVDFPEDDKD
jgi:DNA gyrase/topoisomerase IV subunit A